MTPSARASVVVPERFVAKLVFARALVKYRFVPSARAVVVVAARLFAKLVFAREVVK